MHSCLPPLTTLLPVAPRYDVEKAAREVDQADTESDNSSLGFQGDRQRLSGACDLSEWGKHVAVAQCACIVFVRLPVVMLHVRIDCSSECFVLL